MIETDALAFIDDLGYFEKREWAKKKWNKKIKYFVSKPWTVYLYEADYSNEIVKVLVSWLDDNCAPKDMMFKNVILMAEIIKMLPEDRLSNFERYYNDMTND